MFYRRVLLLGLVVLLGVSAVVDGQTIGQLVKERDEIKAKNEGLKQELEAVKAELAGMSDLDALLAELSAELSKLKEQKKQLVGRNESLENSIGSYQKNMAGLKEGKEVVVNGFPLKGITMGQYTFYRNLSKHVRRIRETINEIKKVQYCNEGMESVYAGMQKNPQLAEWYGTIHRMQVFEDGVDVSIYSSMEGAAVAFCNWYDQKHRYPLSEEVQEVLKDCHEGQLIRFVGEVKLIHCCADFKYGPLVIDEELADEEFNTGINLAREYMSVYYGRNRLQMYMPIEETPAGRRMASDIREGQVRLFGDRLDRYNGRFGNDKEECVMVGLVDFQAIELVDDKAIGRY